MYFFSILCLKYLCIIKKYKICANLKTFFEKIVDKGL